MQVNDSLIYDIGMHNGDDAAHYLDLGYNVIAIDASPDLVREGRQRFQSFINSNKLQILNVGISNQEGSFDFYENKKNSAWNSFDKGIGTRDGADFVVRKIQTRRLDQIVREKGLPYYMKIDIEGYDMFCLQALQESGLKPKFISVELGHIHLIFKLKDIGYTRFKIIDQGSFLPLQVPALPEYERYRRHVAFKESRSFPIKVVRKLFRKSINNIFENGYKHVFNYDHPFGSSGPFGKKLPGRWLDFEQALHVYLHYKFLHQQSSDADYSYWIDIHATTEDQDLGI